MQNVYSTSREISQHTKKGVVHYKARQYKQALPYFKEVVKYWKDEEKARTLAPNEMRENLAPSLFNLGSAELELGEFKQACSNLGEAAGLDKDNQKYARRHKKARLYSLFSTLSIRRYKPGSRIKEPGSRAKVFEDTLDVWHKKNYISLSEAFSRNVGGLQNFFDNLKQLTKTKEYHIVSLGCGFAEDAYMLLNVLGEELFDKIKYVGIDLTFGAGVSEAGENVYRRMADSYKQVGYGNVVFSGINAKEVEAVRDLLRCKADLIIIRHPELTSSFAFPDILKNTVPAISRKDGQTIIFVSTYFEDELQTALHYLNNSPTPYVGVAFKLEESIYHSNGGLIEEGENESLCCDQYSCLIPYLLKTSELKEDKKSTPMTAGSAGQLNEPLREQTGQQAIRDTSVCDKVAGFFAQHPIATALVSVVATAAVKIATDDELGPGKCRVS